MGGKNTYKVEYLFLLITGAGKLLVVVIDIVLSFA